MVVVWWCGAAFLLHYIDGTTNFGLYQKILTENVRSKPCNCWNSKRPQNEGCNQSLDQIQSRNSAVTLRKMLYAQERLNVTELKLFLHTDAGHQKRVVSCSACCFFTGFWLRLVLPSRPMSGLMFFNLPVRPCPRLLHIPSMSILSCQRFPSCSAPSFLSPSFHKQTRVHVSLVYSSKKLDLSSAGGSWDGFIGMLHNFLQADTIWAFFLWTWKWNVKGSFSYGWKKKNLS